MAPKLSSQDTAPPPSPRVFNGFSEITSFIWSVAELLRGDDKQANYGTESRHALITAAVTGKIDLSMEVA